MGEDLDIIDVDIRQRKSGKNKNQNDESVTSGGGGGGGDGGHGSSKKRRRGRGGGGGDRNESIKVIPEEEIFNDPKEKKGKIIINKKPESDDDAGDDGDDAYDSSFEDEESSGSWLFKLIIIAIIVSLGFSLIWLNDGSSTDLDGTDSDVPLNDIGDNYIPENIENDEDTVRGDIEETNYQEYQQWNQEYDDSGRAEIIAEVSETIGEPSSQMNEMGDESEYENQQVSQDEGYFGDEQIVSDQESLEPKTWKMEENYQTENVPEEDQFTSFQEPELVNTNNQQSDHDYIQETWKYQEQVEQQQYQHVEEAIIEQQIPEKDQQPEKAQPYEQYEHHSDEQLAQSSFEMNPEIVETRENEPEERYYECPEGSYWDGLSCVNPESFNQMDHFNNVDENKPEIVEENIFYPENE